MRVVGSIIAVAVLALAAIDSPKIALAQAITVSGQNIFADNRSINDVGVGSGDVLQFGADISGGSAGYSGAGIFTPGAGSTAPPLTQTLGPCAPLSVDKNFCARDASFTTAQQLNGTWDFKIQNPTKTATAIFPLPSTLGIPPTPVPFPASVTITNSANGVNPTINWTLPAGFTPDAFRVLIFDRSTAPLANGQHDVIHSVILLPTATSYTLPTTLSSGQSLVVGDKYSINFQLQITRDGTSNPTNSNADILTRSNSWFDFTPQPGNTTPSNIALPMVGTNGVYHFNIGSVGPDSETFIDPAIAIGYIYDVGVGDPNFASVILPNVGGGVFDLSYLSTEVVLHAGVKYFFPTGGVSEFKVTGIDPSADLDPADTSAFVTGLTFVHGGSFTGTMTPITETVPVLTSGDQCNGVFDGTFDGDVTISAGQKCVFTNPCEIRGNVTARGGSFDLACTVDGNVTERCGSDSSFAEVARTRMRSDRGNECRDSSSLVLRQNASVGGNVQISGMSALSLAAGVTIGGNLQIKQVSGGQPQGTVCGAQIMGNLQVKNNLSPIEIGANNAHICAGNAVGGNLQADDNDAALSIDDNIVGGDLEVRNNSGTTDVSGNKVAENLQCQGNAQVTHVTANMVSGHSKGQCTAFP